MMPEISSLLRNVAHEDGGIITNIAVHKKPLWFSSVVFATARSNAHELVSDYIKNFHRAKRAAIDATKVDLTRKKNPFTSSLQGAGLGTTEGDAVIRAVGEAIERYGAKLAPVADRVVHGSFSELKKDYAMIALDRWNHALQRSDDLHTMSAKHQIVSLREETEINWIHVSSLSKNREVLAPTSHALFGSFRHFPGEVLLAESISTGLASHSDFDKAVLSGLCEVIERDAFVGMWGKRLCPPRLSKVSMLAASPAVRSLVSCLEKTNFRLTVNDLTSDVGVPIFLATFVSDEPPYTVVGAGCHPDADIALEKAIAECYMSLVGYAIFDGFNDDDNGGALLSDASIDSMHDHGRYYRINRLSERLDFYLSAPEKDYDKGDYCPRDKMDMRELVRRLGELQLEVLVHDLTNDELKNAGWNVVKVLVPGMIPLHCREVNKPLGCARLKKYASGEIFPTSEASLGSGFNVHAHPFP